MDELIVAFITNHYTDELKAVLYDALELFNKYDYQEVDADLLNLINAEGFINPEELQDNFIVLIHEKLDYVLNEHSIQLQPEVDLGDKVAIVNALWLVQNLDDYTGIIRILESLEEDEVKLALIIADLSTLDSTYLMTLIASFNPTILTTLKEFIYMKEQETEVKAPAEILATTKRFFTFLKYKQRGSLGEQLVKARIPLGNAFASYLPFIQDDLIALEKEQTAINLLSVLMLSHDGQAALLPTFRKYSAELLHDLNLISSIETHILSCYNQFTEFQKAQNEKIRLSQTSTQ